MSDEGVGRRARVGRRAMTNPKTLPFNWEVVIVCVHCHAEFDAESADPSVGLVDAGDSKRRRVVLVWVPNECPSCHSIHAVEAAEST